MKTKTVVIDGYPMDIAYKIADGMIRVCFITGTQPPRMPLDTLCQRLVFELDKLEFSSESKA